MKIEAFFSKEAFLCFYRLPGTFVYGLYRGKTYTQRAKLENGWSGFVIFHESSDISVAFVDAVYYKQADHGCGTEKGANLFSETKNTIFMGGQNDRLYFSSLLEGDICFQYDSMVEILEDGNFSYRLPRVAGLTIRFISYKIKIENNSLVKTHAVCIIQI